MIRRPPRSTRTDTLFPTRRSSDLNADAVDWLLFRGKHGRECSGRYPGIFLDRHFGSGKTALQHTYAVRRRRACDLRHGWAHWRYGGDGAVRLAGACYLFHRCPPALCADRRNGLSAVRRLLLLDTYDEPPRPFGAAGKVDFLADVRWDACDFSAHAPHRLHGHAPAGVYLPARPRLGDNEPPFHGRRFYPSDGRAPLRGRSPTAFPPDGRP